MKILSSEEKLKAISDGGFVDDNGRWNSLIFKDNRCYRNRVEVIIINDKAEIFLAIEDNGKDYKIPGGSLERDSDPIKQAIAETREEAYLIINDIQYSGIHIEELYNNSTPEDIYDGKISNIVTAKYVSTYDGFIPEEDRDEFIKNNGKFYSFDEVSDILHPAHYTAYMNRVRPSNNTEKILPYYTPSEMEELGVYNTNESDNYFRVVASKDNSEWFKTYSETYDPGDDWVDMVKEAYSEFIQNKTSENKQTLLELGWNPSINPSDSRALYLISEKTKQRLYN